MAEIFPGLHIHQGKSFCFDLHCIYTVETKERSAILKTLEKLTTYLNKHSYMSHVVKAESVPSFHIRKSTSKTYKPDSLL